DIRGLHVTRVQTCALPISSRCRKSPSRIARRALRNGDLGHRDAGDGRLHPDDGNPSRPGPAQPVRAPAHLAVGRVQPGHGRARGRRRLRAEVLRTRAGSTGCGPRDRPGLSPPAPLDGASGTPLACLHGRNPPDGGPMSDFLGIHGTALALREQRLQLLAANIANADTPGYQAQDLDFNGALSAALRPSAEAGDAIAGAAEAARYTRPSAQPSLDGNTVDGDRENAVFAQAVLEYRASMS